MCALARTYDKATLLARAADVDDGFDLQVFASMLDTLGRFTDADIPVPPLDVSELRHFFASWAAALRDQQ